MNSLAYLTLLYFVVVLYSSAATGITVLDPWKNSVWRAGQSAVVTWNTTQNEAGLKCEIQLMTGDHLNGTVVATVTNPGQPVSCSEGKFTIPPLNDFAKGDYWIRIGQTSTNTWSYSSKFNFDGKGSADILRLASSVPPVASKTQTDGKSMTGLTPVASVPKTSLATTVSTSPVSSPSTSPRKAVHDKGSSEASSYHHRLWVMAGATLAVCVFTLLLQ